MRRISWIVLACVLCAGSVRAEDKGAAAAGRSHVEASKPHEMGPMTTAEKRVGILFGAVILSWMLRRPLTEWLGLSGISDTNIVIAAAVLFLTSPAAGWITGKMLAIDGGQLTTNWPMPMNHFMR